jgi:hypothetical protein
MLEMLDKMFIKHYKATFDHLNRNVFEVPYENGSFEAPTVQKFGSGVTKVSNATVDPVPLHPPMRVAVVRRPVKAVVAVQRVAVPIDELEIALKNEAYFIYLMNSVITQAVSEYKAAFGSDAQARFGNMFCSPFHPDSDTANIFRESTLDGHYEFKLYGRWAEEKQGE